MSAKPIVSSRFGRVARLGWLSRRALPLAFRRLTDRGSEGAALDDATARRHGAAAEEAFRTLGSLKGLAMKIGQTLSYVDGVLPAASRRVYQDVLARLQREAPPMSWAAVEPVLVEDLGRPVAAVFSSFEPEPFAAASIGQVHRARLAGGEEVAVKIQYPGIGAAVAADLDNAALLRSFAGPLLGISGRGATYENIKETLAEVAARFLEELDYEREASMQRRFADFFADDPEIHVPRVFGAACGPRVLTSEYIDGRTLAEVCASASQPERDRYAAALTRATYGSIYEHRLFNADPHPGNYLFPASGRLVLLDFGCVKELPAWLVAAMIRYLRAAMVATRTGAAADWAEFDSAICEAFRLDPAEPRTYELYRRFILYLLEPYVRDEPFEFTPEYSGASIEIMLAGQRELFRGSGLLPRLPRLPAVPADFTFISRLQWGFYSVLTMLRARGNWYRMLPASLHAL